MCLFKSKTFQLLSAVNIMKKSEYKSKCGVNGILPSLRTRCLAFQGLLLHCDRFDILKNNLVQKAEFPVILQVEPKLRASSQSLR